MKLKAIIVMILIALTTLTFKSISADETLAPGLYVTIYAEDNHIYQDTNSNRIDFSKDELKYNSDVVAFTYNNGEYILAVDPADIEVEYPNGTNTDKVIEDNLSLEDTNDEWKVTKTPYSLVYTFVYQPYDEIESQRVEIDRKTETIFVTVEEQLSFYEQFSWLVFDPLKISRSIVRLVGFNLTSYSITKEYYEFVCNTSTIDYDSNSDIGCGISLADYQTISGWYNDFIGVMFTAILGFAIISVIFRFIKSFFDSNPNLNNFRLASVIKRLGSLIFILMIMFNLDNIMMFMVHIFSIITVSFYGMVENIFDKPVRGFGEDLKNALVMSTKNISLKKVIFGKVAFEEWITNLFLGFILNGIFLLTSMYMMLKVGLISVKRVLNIIIAIVLAPIFVGYYLEPEKSSVASKFFSRFFASLLSALVLLIVTMGFIFLNLIFISIIKITFYEILGADATKTAARSLSANPEGVITVIGYIMLMFFYARTISKSEELVEELIVRKY